MKSPETVSIFSYAESIFIFGAGYSTLFFPQKACWTIFKMYWPMISLIISDIFLSSQLVDLFRLGLSTVHFGLGTEFFN